MTDRLFPLLSGEMRKELLRGCYAWAPTLAAARILRETRRRIQIASYSAVNNAFICVHLSDAADSLIRKNPDSAYIQQYHLMQNRLTSVVQESLRREPTLKHWYLYHSFGVYDGIHTPTIEQFNQARVE